MLFVNTRPQDRAAALTAALSNQQISVFELPLLELQALKLSAELYELYRQLPCAQVIVVVSPTAVEVGMQYLQQTGIQLEQLSHIHWIAVGVKTAQVLEKYGIHALIPEVETSEGMLQLPCLQKLPQGSRIAFWRGEGGRQFMMQQLQAQGMHILNFVLYQRQCPPMCQTLMPLLAKKIQENLAYAVLISSEASWLNWQALWQNQPEIITKAHYMVLGTRVAQLLQQDRQQQQADFQITRLDTLHPTTILAHLKLEKGKA